MNTANNVQNPEKLPDREKNISPNNLSAIPFSQNWNNKLTCQVFTTIRLHNPGKYQVGRKYNIILSSKKLCEAAIVSIKVIRIDQINDWVSLIDTALQPEDFKAMLRKMYCKIVKDWSTQTLDFILLSKAK